MKYIVFHLHFYQPPRINPFVEEIELQPSAYPYENWNERIAMECYIPNTYARIFDLSGYIVNIINNLEYVSFNFGPTLMSWIKSRYPDLYNRILEADRESIKRLGFGNSISQAYNHVILPLVNDVDKENQIYWGVRDFEYHFNRKPAGMWLPETAVDIATLEKLAQEGLKFTILAPHQIKCYRRIGSKEWIDNRGSIPSRPFLVNLPSGASIVVFTFNSDLSRGISFDDFLSSGERLARLIISEFKEENDIIVIATDGETYGHHKKFGELGLAYCIYTMLSNPSTKVCNLEYYLANVGIDYEAEINEYTSWSCFHGVSRWQDNCGCRFDPNTSQEWRKCLKIAVDSVRNTFEEIYKDNLDKDLRKFYIEYILKRENEIKDKEDLEKLVCSFMRDFGIDDCQQAKKIINLLEIYKNILFAYTSCGWFFDDISGLEATQNLKFLYWAILKLKELFGINLEPVISTILASCKSNYYRDGLEVFEKLVKSSALEFESLAASAIVDKIFIGSNQSRFLGCFWEFQEMDRYSLGDFVISSGKIKSINFKDFREREISFLFAYLGNLSLYIGLGDFKPDFSTFKKLLLANNLVDVFNLIEKYSKKTFSLNDIFINVRLKVINNLIFSNVKNIDQKVEEIFFEQKTIIRNLIENNYHLIPLEMRLITLLILDKNIEDAIDNFDCNHDYDEILYFISNKFKLGLSLDEEKIKVKFQEKLKNMLLKLINLFNLDDLDIFEILDSISLFIDFGFRLKLDYNLWESQNLMFSFYNNFVKNKQYFMEKYGKGFYDIERKIISLADKLKIRLMI